MLFDYYPWQLEVDAEATRLLYTEKDYSTDKALNTAFFDALGSKQRQFFESLGVDISKIEIDKAVYDLPGEEGVSPLKMNRISVHFLVKGSFRALPQFQKDLYSDGELFGKKFPDTVKALSYDGEDYIKTYDNGIGAGVVFKHPCLHCLQRKKTPGSTGGKRPLQ